MGKMWHEFKNFAAGGNMIDLAIGFIIGGAFATVVESLATDVIGDFIAALGGAPDLSGWTVGVRDGDVHIGKFVGSVISFAIMAIVLFGMVRLLKKGGIGNFRAQGQREWPLLPRIRRGRRRPVPALHVEAPSLHRRRRGRRGAARILS